MKCVSVILLALVVFSAVSADARRRRVVVAAVAPGRIYGDALHPLPCKYILVNGVTPIKNIDCSFRCPSIVSARELETL